MGMSNLTFNKMEHIHITIEKLRGFSMILFQVDGEGEEEVSPVLTPLDFQW
jgi:hypothetical protein